VRVASLPARRSPPRPRRAAETRRQREHIMTIGNTSNSTGNGGTAEIYVAQKNAMLARLKSLITSYREENPFSMHPATEREWERTLEAAEEAAFVTGASEEEIETTKYG
jgi:hypothetical protein